MTTSSSTSFDVIVIGAGPGGIAAATSGALRGLRVALLNRGPLMGYGLEGAFKSKSLYEISHAHHAVHHRWALPQGGGYEVDFRAIYEANQAGAQGLRGVHRRQLMDLGVTLIDGAGQFVDAHTIGVGERLLQGETIIIATGTRPRLLEDIQPVPGKIFTSDDIVNVDHPIESLVVLGAGVIGCEFASIFSALGSQVTLLDSRPRIFSHDDEDVSQLLQTCLAGQGVVIHPSARCKSMKVEGEQVYTELANGKVLTSDAALLAIGRSANIEDLNIEAIGLRTNQYGYILTDDCMRTNIPHIFAVGDMGLRDSEHDLSLVHVAEAEGRAAMDAICKVDAPLSTAYVPFIIFTHPMIAGSGYCEAEARELFGDVRVGKWAHIRNHRAHAMSSRKGFVKLIVGPEGDDSVLGVRAIGGGVDAIVGEVSVMIQHKLPYTYLLETTHAHPSFSESLHGAARIISGTAAPYREGEEFALELPGLSR